MLSVGNLDVPIIKRNQSNRINTELRDPQANYNKMTLAEFKENYPNIPLEALANAEGIKSEYLKEMIVGQLLTSAMRFAKPVSNSSVRL